MAQQPGFDFSTLVNLVASATEAAKNQLLSIQNNKSSVSIGDMFQMQMQMNQLSQLSEMSTAVINAANSSTVSMARNVKG